MFHLCSMFDATRDDFHLEKNVLQMPWNQKSELMFLKARWWSRHLQHCYCWYILIHTAATLGRCWNLSWWSLNIFLLFMIEQHVLVVHIPWTWLNIHPLFEPHGRPTQGYDIGGTGWRQSSLAHQICIQRRVEDLKMYHVQGTCLPNYVSCCVDYRHDSV